MAFRCNASAFILGRNSCVGTGFFNSTLTLRRSFNSATSHLSHPHPPSRSSTSSSFFNFTPFSSRTNTNQSFRNHFSSSFFRNAYWKSTSDGNRITTISRQLTQRVQSFSSSAVCKIRPHYYVKKGNSSGGSGRSSSSGGGGPWTRFTQWFNSLPFNYIIYGTIALNGAVFISWNLADATWKRFGDLSQIRWMQENFLYSWENLRGGRFWTLITPCFSHNEGMHFLINMFVFWSFGGVGLAMLGATRFMSLYLLSGLGGGAASLLWNASRPNYRSHGASGAIAGVVAFTACVNPMGTVYVYFFPVKFWVFLPLYVGYNVYLALQHPAGKTDAAGHIGGTATGMAWFALALLRARRGRIGRF